MKKIQLLCLVSLLSVGIANASTPCNGFQIKIKNDLQDDLVVTTMKLNGAELQHGGFQTLDSKKEAVLIVADSDVNTPMTGEFIFHTISLPSRTVHLNFNLSNQFVMCQHTDHSTNDDYSVGIFRLPGQVSYTIGN